MWLRFLYGWFLFLVASVPLWTILQRTRTISQWVASATTMVCCNMSHKAIQSDSCLAEFLPTHSTGSYVRPNWQIICHRCTAGCIGQWVCYIFPQVAQAHSWWLRRHTVVGKYLYRSLIIENPEMLHFCSWFFRACPGTSFQEISFMEFSVCIFRCCFCPQSLQHMQTAHLWTAMNCKV